MKKTKIISAILTLTIMLSFFTGCGTSSTQKSSTQSVASQIVIGRASECDSLDPNVLNDNTSVWTLSLMLEGLVKTNDDGTKIVPDLAKNWNISKDGLVYTFHLIPNLKFSDGSKVTKDDWLFTFQRAMSVADSYWSFATKNIDKVEAPNDNTVIITLKAPSASTLANLTMFNLAVQSKKYYEKVGSYANTAPMGTGEYSLKTWKKDDYMLLTKNNYYYKAGLPKTKELKFKVVADDDSRVMQLKSKNLDVITDVPFSSMNTLKSESGIKTIGIQSTGNRYLILNTTDPILSNKKIRQALLYATDKSELVKAMLYGYGQQAVSYMPKGGLDWNNQIVPAKYNTKKAKELLKEAGYANGFNIEFLVKSGNQEYQQIATIVKEQWAKIGVNVNIVSLEKASLLEKEYAMKHQVLIGTWSDDLPDPGELGDYFWNYDVSKGFYTGYKNSNASDIYEKTKTELNNNKRKDLFFQLQKTVYDDSPIINLYHPDITVATTDYIKGFSQTPLGKYSFDNLVKIKK